MFSILKKIIKRKCKHKEYIFETLYDDGWDIYKIKRCKKCNSTRTYWQNKYFYPAIPVDEWK